MTRLFSQLSTVPLTTVVAEDIDDAALLDSSVPVIESADLTLWQSGATYAAGQRVVYGRRIFEFSGNTESGYDNTRPPPQWPDRWIDIDPTARWAPFEPRDIKRTAMGASQWWEVELPRATRYFGIINSVDLSSVRLVITDTSDPANPAIVYDQTRNTRALPVRAGWFNWFFGKRRASTTLPYFDDLPIVLNGVMRIEVEGTDALQVGKFIIGQPQSWGGGALKGSSRSTRNYSKTAFNDYGVLTFRQGVVSPQLSFTFQVEWFDSDALGDYLEDAENKATLVIASDTHRALTIFGWITKWEISYDEYDIHTISLNVEGFSR